MQWALWILPPGVKRPNREVNHLCSQSTRVMNVWSFAYTPLSASVVWLLGKSITLRSNFTEIRVMMGQGRYFSLHHHVQIKEPTQLPVEWVSGLKRTEHVNGAEVRNAVCISFLWSSCMHSWHRHNFTFCVALGNIYSWVSNVWRFQRKAGWQM
jgi:hypothetical protein